MLRAKPSTVFNSSTVPYVSTRWSAFEMRIPPANPVCPPSPRFVAMLMVFLLSSFGSVKWFQRFFDMNSNDLTKSCPLVAQDHIVIEKIRDLWRASRKQLLFIEEPWGSCSQFLNAPRIDHDDRHAIHARL